MTVEFILSIVNLVDIGAFPKKPLKLSEDEGQHICEAFWNIWFLWWPAKKRKKKRKKRRMNSLSPNSGKYYKWQ